MAFQDRVTGILDAHLASVSNRLADVSRLLAVMVVSCGVMYWWFRRAGWL